MSIPVEDLLTDLGIRSDVEDIKNFASVFAIARKMGGNMVEIVQDAADQIQEKAEVERSIETAIAAKKFEQTIMAVMPCIIIFYMQITSPGFFSQMYGTIFGIIIPGNRVRVKGWSYFPVFAG